MPPVVAGQNGGATGASVAIGREFAGDEMCNLFGRWEVREVREHVYVWSDRYDGLWGDARATKIQGSETLEMRGASLIEAPESGAKRHVVWSGSLAQADAESFEERVKLRFAPDPRTWGPRGWSMLDAACERAAQSAVRFWIRTHARHVLSDIPGCARLLRTWGERGIGVMIDPAAMMTVEMLAGRARDDLIKRAYEDAQSLAEVFPGLVLVNAANARAGRADGAEIVPIAVGECSTEVIQRGVKGLDTSVGVVVFAGDERDL